MSGEEEASKSSFGQVLLVMQQISKDVGALARDVGDNKRQNEAIAAQQTQIVTQNTNVADEIRKLATELVDVRARVATLEQSTPIPMRPRLPSFSEEDRRNQIESIKTVASESEKQTPYLEVIAKQTESLALQTESQRPMLYQVSKSAKWMPFYTLGMAVAAFAAGCINSCHH